MTDEPTWAAAQLRVLLDALAKLGLDTAELCEACGVDDEALRDPDARVARSLSSALWSEAARRMGQGHLGLCVAEVVRPRAVGPVAYLLLSSATLGEGIERLVAHQALFDESSTMSLQSEGPHLFLSVSFGTRTYPATPDQIEYRLAFLRKFFSWVTDHEIRPVEARFAHAAPADRSLHERVLKCPVRFEAGEAGLLLCRDDLTLPSVHANPRLARAHAAVAAHALAALETRSYSARARAVVTLELERGIPELAAAARRLHVSARTLQRRLAAEGTRYCEIVDAVRRELTLERLEQSQASIGDIARQAGFSDPSAFYRAFKRWTGLTPHAYRAERAQ